MDHKTKLNGWIEEMKEKKEKKTHETNKSNNNDVDDGTKHFLGFLLKVAFSGDWCAEFYLLLAMNN